MPIQRSSLKWVLAQSCELQKDLQPMPLIMHLPAGIWERTLMPSIKCKWREAARPCKADVWSCEPAANLWLKKFGMGVGGLDWERRVGAIENVCSPWCWEWGLARGWEWGRHLEWIWGEPEKAWRPPLPPPLQYANFVQLSVHQSVHQSLHQSVHYSVHQRVCTRVCTRECSPKCATARATECAPKCTPECTVELGGGQHKDSRIGSSATLSGSTPKQGALDTISTNCRLSAKLPWHQMVNM